MQAGKFLYWTGAGLCPDREQAEEFQDRDSAKQKIRNYQEAFPDYKMRVTPA